MAEGGVIRELITVWGFDVKDEPLKKLDKSIGTLKNSLTVVSGLVVGLGATLFGFAKHAANVGDEAIKASRSLGVNVESLQEIRHAADMAGVSKEELGISLQKVAKNAYEAAHGNADLKKTFKELGVSVKDSTGKVKSADVLLTELSGGFQKMPDGTRKSAMAIDLFGKSGTKMISLLNEGPAGLAKFRQEARDLGIVMSEDAAKAAEEFNDSFARLKKVVEGFTQFMGIELFPVIKEIIDETKEWLMANRQMIKEDLSAFLKATIGIFKSLVGILKNTWSFVNTLARAFGGMGNVIKWLTNIFVIFLSLKILFGLGQLAQALVAVTAGFKVMGLAALWAQAKLLLIPIAIGAIIAMIALIVEDIIAFTQGRDSVLGRMVGGFSSMFDTLSQKFSALGGLGNFITTVLLGPIRGVVTMIRNLIVLFDILRGKLDVIEGAKKIGENIKSMLGFQSGSLKEALGFGKDSSIKGAVQNIGNATQQIATEASPTVIGERALSASAPAGKQINVNSKADVKVNVEGMDSQAAQEMVTGTLRDELSGIMRETVREGEGQVER